MQACTVWYILREFNSHFDWSQIDLNLKSEWSHLQNKALFYKHQKYIPRLIQIHCINRKLELFHSPYMIYFLITTAY